jgi:hypothetical protein
LLKEYESFLLNEGFQPLSPPKDNLYQWINGDFKTVFTNDGTDFIDYGRPQWAVDNLRPSVDEFTIELEGIVEADGTFFSLGSAVASSARQLQLFSQTGLIKVVLGGDLFTTTLTHSFGEYLKITLEVRTDGFTVTLNGVSEIGTIGGVTSTENLYIGGRTDGASFNYEGKIWDVKFYSGVGSSKTLLEHFPLDGSPDGVNGTIGTVTDGTPTGVWDYQLCQDKTSNGLYALRDGSGNINLNPTADATLTGYGYDGTFQTQSALDALYNGTTIFPSPPAQKDRYLSFSPATTNATKADKYVKR